MMQSSGVGGRGPSSTGESRRDGFAGLLKAGRVPIGGTLAPHDKRSPLLDQLKRVLDRLRGAGLMALLAVTLGV